MEFREGGKGSVKSRDKKKEKRLWRHGETAAKNRTESRRSSHETIGLERKRKETFKGGRVLGREGESLGSPFRLPLFLREQASSRVQGRKGGGGGVGKEAGQERAVDGWKLSLT